MAFKRSGQLHGLTAGSFDHPFIDFGHIQRVKRVGTRGRPNSERDATNLRMFIYGLDTNECVYSYISQRTTTPIAIS